MTCDKTYTLINALKNPALFPHEVKYFKVIETHISWVILTGHYAYKIKKTLDLGFLDFSSLEKRRHYCLEELRLNSRLAPELYLGLVAINGTEEHPTLDGSGTAIEYAVKMQQFEPDNTFDKLLTKNLLNSEHLKQTAKIIATFHSKIAITATNTEFGSADAVMRPVTENFKQILQLDGIEKPESLKHLALWSEQQHTALQPFFTQRKKDGFIRECHGDLHLRNIALIDHTVVPFDGIEFNPSLYWIDMISEISFLVMDLQNRQRQDLAFQFLNEYLQHSGDYAGLKLLRFYQVYRAIVMAKVSAIRASQRSSSEKHQLDIAKYHCYLQLANHYTQKTTPLLIIMHGVSGSGKSWLSGQIISRYQVIRIRSDVERKRLHNLSPQQASHSDIKSDLYSQTSNDKTYQYLLKLCFEVLDAGYNVIVDATFLLQQQRKLFSLQARQQHIPCLILHTHSDTKTLQQRIKDRTRQQGNVSEADQTVLENQLDKIQPLSDKELKYSITVDTEKEFLLSRLWKLLDDRCHSCQ